MQPLQRIHPHSVPRLNTATRNQSLKSFWRAPASVATNSITCVLCVQAQQAAVLTLLPGAVGTDTPSIICQQKALKHPHWQLICNGASAAIGVGGKTAETPNQWTALLGRRQWPRQACPPAAIPPQDRSAPPAECAARPVQEKTKGPLQQLAAHSALIVKSLRTTALAFTTTFHLSGGPPHRSMSRPVCSSASVITWIC